MRRLLNQNRIGGKNIPERIMDMIKNHGKFCEVFGINPRNQILELFLEGREIDFAPGDIARITGLNRATTYNTIKVLLSQNLIIQSRTVSGGQLYKLNVGEKKARLLVEVFNLLLERIAVQHPWKKERKRHFLTNKLKSRAKILF